MQAGLGGFFSEGLVRLRRHVVARGQAGGNLTLTWMKAIVTIENPSMRRMNAHSGVRSSDAPQWDLPV